MACPPSLIRVFAVRMKKAWVPSCPLSAQRRLWSDWADTQADLSLRWAHAHFVCFVMSRLISQNPNICGHVIVNSMIPKMKITSYFLHMKSYLQFATNIIRHLGFLYTVIKKSTRYNVVDCEIWMTVCNENFIFIYPSVIVFVTTEQREIVQYAWVSTWIYTDTKF